MSLPVSFRLRPVLFGWLLLFSSFHWAAADTPSVVDASFDPGLGADHDVFAIALQADQTILIGGQFTTFNGTNRSRIARLNADGSLDLSFDPGTGANGDVYAIAVQSDGKVIITGAFTRINDITILYIARLHTNGAVDLSFNPGISVDNELRAIAVQPDGKVIIAGRFTSVAGQGRGRIARLNFDGSLDAGFNPGTGANGNVRTVCLQSDGRILIGGQFTTFNGVSRAGITRLMPDGSLDATFDSGTGADDQVRTIAIRSDGMIYIGGDFETYNGTNRSAVARLFSNGGLDLAFNQGDPLDDTVRAIAVPSDGAVWIGGLFAEAGGSSRINIARVLGSGTADSLYPPATGANDEVFSLVLQPDGYLLAAGKFSFVNGIGRRRVVRLFGDPTVNSLEFSGDYVAAEMTGGAGITVIRHGDSQRMATADVKLKAVTATPGVDYASEGLHFVFAPAETEKTAIVRIFDDHQDEPAETVDLHFSRLSAGAVLGIRSRAELKIVDNGGVVTWQDSALQVSEDAGWVSVVARRSGDLSVLVYVPFTTIDGTARAGVDYQATSGWLGFGTGGFIAGDNVPLFNNGVRSPNRTFYVRLGPSTNGAILSGPIDLPVTIADNEIGFVFSRPFYSASEDLLIAHISVEKLWDAADNASVRYRTVGGTASAGVDYVPQDGVLTFAPGEFMKRFDVPMLNDALRDDEETVELQLYAAQGEVPLGAQTNATMRIYDSDEGIEFVSTHYTVAESAGTVELQVRRRDDFTNVLSVHYATVDDTAQAGRDYVAQSGELVLLPGGTVALQIRLIDDHSIGPDRNFAVVLTDPGPGASLGRETTAVVRILDEQRPGSLDMGFASRLVLPNQFLSGVKAALLVQSDGNIVFGDWANAVRYFPDGQLDPNFVAGYSGAGYEGPSLGQQADGRLIVGKESGATFGFSSVIRLEADGSIDPNFGVFAPVGWTRTVQVQPDQKILIGGNYVDLWPPSFPLNNGISRLETNGVVDATFNAGTFLPEGNILVLPEVAAIMVSHLVEDIVLQPDGKLVVVGVFTNVAGTACDRVVRLNSDGSIDPQFALHADLASSRGATVAQIALQPDGKLILAGNFTNLLGVGGNHLLRLHSDGTVDPSFRSPLESAEYVECIALQLDGKLLAGGVRSGTSGRTASHFVIRLNLDGTIDSTFDAGLPANRRVTDIALLADGDILIAGEFYYFNGYPCSRLAKLHGGALRMEPPVQSPGGLDLVVQNARADHPVVLLRSSNLQTWTAVQTNPPVGSLARFTLAPLTNAVSYFYRAAQR